MTEPTPTEITAPKSPADKAGGMAYFPRMLDKIRLQAAGRLGPDYQENYGKGVDGWCTDFLRIRHEDLVHRVAKGGTDEEILQWCFTQGRELNRTDLFVWNHFVAKLGWKDIATKVVRRLKSDRGFEDRDDIVTMVDFIDADEGRSA